MKKNNILFFLAVISSFIIIAILINVFYPSFGIGVNMPQSNIDKINNTLLSLATSYITGYIIFIITIYLPNKERKKIYNQFTKDIIFQFYYSVIMLYNSYRTDEIQDELIKFNKDNESFVSFFLDNLKYSDGRIYYEVLKDQRNDFLNNINLFIEYLSEEQLKQIRIIRTTPLIMQLELNEVLFIKDKKILLKNDKLAIQKNQIYKEYVRMIIRLKETIG
jgi:hypothetical protein